MKHHAPQFEIGWKDEPFRLVQETALDGNRIVQERQKKSESLAEQERKQIAFNPRWAENNQPLTLPCTCRCIQCEAARLDETVVHCGSADCRGKGDR